MSCTDSIDDINTPSNETDSYKGEMIQFAAGTTVNSVSTRADGEGESNTNSSYTVTPGKTYYMPDSYRFVCRMYYKASTSSDKYDVSGNTDVTAWLKVKGDVGNSLYWRNSFADLGTDESIFDTYGNDKEATMFYWQNRKEHAFLAWTNLNKARTIGYDPTPNSGALKFQPEDIIYEKHTGQKEVQWIDNGYEVQLKNGETQIFESWAALRTYMETGTNYNNVESSYGGLEFNDEYYYAYGWSCKYRLQKNASYESTDDNHHKYGWYEYQMFYDKLKYEGEKTGTNIEIRKNEKKIPAYLYNKATNKYLAEIEIKYYKLDAENNITTEVFTPTESTTNTTQQGGALDQKTVHDGDIVQQVNEDGSTTSAQCVWVYNLTDDYGNVKYDETKPRYTFYYKLLQEKKNAEVVNKLPANAFDLTRGADMNSIADQPDIAQALTIQAPLGATQAANRVNLYFKHQFSLVQVNVKSSADLSVVINKNHIQKVELLGVTEKGYVFTEMDEDGHVEPANYESVDVSKYDDEHLKKNQYGTSFNMFDMYDPTDTDNNGYALGYIKSFNALTFGQLQAIRITWNEEENGSGISHESTYHVADETLKNLQSGYKYIWNIELRRGTLAIVRTEIVDWIVPQNELEYGTSGTINN